MSDVKTLREKRGVGILPAFILAYSILIRFRIFLLTQEEEVNFGYKGLEGEGVFVRQYEVQ